MLHFKIYWKRIGLNSSSSFIICFSDFEQARTQTRNSRNPAFTIIVKIKTIEKYFVE